jgi:effector-binding domain-containing protein
MEIRNVKEEPALAVRTTTSVKELPNTVGRAYGAIVQYLGYNMDMEHLDVEIGFPVASPLPGNGVVHASKIPAGKAAFAVHTGPYATIETTYNALTAFMTERGLVPETWMYERYLNSPEDTPPERLLTEIYFPLKD